MSQRIKRSNNHIVTGFVSVFLRLFFNCQPQMHDSATIPLLIDKDDLFQLIDIREPYFALDNIHVDEQHFAAADFPVEQPIGNEVPPISSAEASRHMAILGVVSCAHANPSKARHYYLAYAVTFKRIACESGMEKAAGLQGNAVCTAIDKCRAAAKTQLLDADGTVISEAEISYHVIREPIFHRLFSLYYLQSPDFSIENPYKLKNRIPDVTLTATLGRLPERHCPGHFPNYPAMPVAILLSHMLDLGGLVIRHVTGNHKLKFLVRAFALSAANLAFAGEKIDIAIKHIHSSGKSHVLSCRAFANGSKSVGDVRVTIEEV